MATNSGYSWYCDTKGLNECSGLLDPLVNRMQNLLDSTSELKNKFNGEFSDLKGKEEILSSFENVDFSMFNVKHGYANIIELIDKILEMNEKYTTGNNADVFNVSVSGTAFTVTLSQTEYKKVKKAFGYEVGVKTKNDEDKTLKSSNKSNSLGASIASGGAVSAISSVASSNANSTNSSSFTTKTGAVSVENVQKADKNKEQATDNALKLKTEKKKTNKTKFDSVGKITGATTTIVGTTVAPSVDKIISSTPPTTSNSFNIKDFLDRLHVTIINKPISGEMNNNTQKPQPPTSVEKPSNPSIVPDVKPSTPPQQGQVSGGNQVNTGSSASTITSPSTGSVTGTSSSYKQSYKGAGSSIASISNEQKPVDTSTSVPNSTDSIKTEEAKLPDYSTDKDLFDIDDIDDDLLSSEVDEIDKSSKGVNPVIPIVGGVVGAAALGIGAKVYKDNKKNNDLALDEDLLTNENKFWTDEEASVIHSEKEIYEEEKPVVVDTKYKATTNDMDDKDTWSMPEDEKEMGSTIDLLESN